MDTVTGAAQMAPAVEGNTKKLPSVLGAFNPDPATVKGVLTVIALDKINLLATMAQVPREHIIAGQLAN